MPGEGVRLYRALLRYGNSLQYTDRSYYRRRIRFEFEKHRVVTEPEEVGLQVAKGRELLRRKALV